MKSLNLLVTFKADLSMNHSPKKASMQKHAHHSKHTPQDILESPSVDYQMRPIIKLKASTTNSFDIKRTCVHMECMHLQVFQYERKGFLGLKKKCVCLNKFYFIFRVVNLPISRAHTVATYTNTIHIPICLKMITIRITYK